MTVQEIIEPDKLFLNAADIADLFGVDAQYIRSQAQEDKDKLGFKCSVIGKRVLIPRIEFLKWLGQE